MSTTGLMAWRRTPWRVLAAALILFFVLAPFYWIVNIALTPEEQSFTQTIRYFPTEVTRPRTSSASSKRSHSAARS